jgi:transcriptional regulator with XRE-family HTH domain
MKIVGEQIKLFRKIRNMTLATLAEKLDVSASFLSQIESGRAMPSLATLKNISDALNVSIGTLVGEGKNTSESPVVRADERSEMKKLGDGLEIRLLSHRDPYIQMEPAIFEFEEGGSTGDFSRHFGQEFIFIMDGSLEVCLASDKYLLKKGDSFYFNSYVPHLFRNKNKGRTRIIRVITPPLLG